jgi:ubiquitin fusion degradation protein 1
MQIMQNLLLPEGGFIVVRNVQLPKARFVKFQPHSKDFIDISNPRAV